MVTASLPPGKYRHASLMTETESEAGKRLESQEESQAKGPDVLPGADGQSRPTPSGQEEEAAESSD